MIRHCPYVMNNSMESIMKKYCLKVVGLLLLTGFHINMTNAQESVVGVWEGALEVAPGTEITVLFDLTENADGSYSAVLNSPDMGAIKDIEASSVSLDGSQLSISVSALSGEYSGSLNNGVFEGEWTQPGSTIPMNLSPYVKAQLSQEAIATLLGQWSGKLVIPGGEFTIVFDFELDEGEEFVGSVQIVEQGAKPAMADISFDGDEIFFRVPQLQAEYRGQVSGDSITGTLLQQGQELALNVSKGEFVEVLPTLELTDANMEQLEGSWAGKMTGITLVFNFDRSEDGVIFVTVDSPDQGVEGLKVEAAQVTDNRLHMSVAGVTAQFRGEIDGENIVGEWSQAGMTNPLTVSKFEGEYVPEATVLALTDADMEILEGSWSGSLGPVTVVFNFQRDEQGTIVATVDIPEQGATGIPVAAAQITDGQLEMEMPVFGAVYSGEISDGTITGILTRAGMPNPLNVTKQ